MIVNFSKGVYEVTTNEKDNSNTKECIDQYIYYD